MPSPVAIIIPNWNGARLLPSCLSALAEQTYRDYCLYIVDNGSSDESMKMLAELDASRTASWFEGELPHPTHVIRNESNLGFAEANNQAMRAALADGYRYIATLNNDAVAERGWLCAMVDAIDEAAPQVGMVASSMLFAHKPDRVASAGISIHRDGIALDRSAGGRIGDVEARGVAPVFGPSAGAALYSAELLRDVGLFDARFFSYLEDADLAWRARARGWKALLAPGAQVLHEYSATGRQGSAFKNRLVARNRVWLLYKNMPAPLLLRHAPAIARYDLLAVIAALIEGNREALRGRLEALLGLGNLTNERRANVASSRLHPDEVDSLLAPAFSPAGHIRYRRRLAGIMNQEFKSQTPIHDS